MAFTDSFKITSIFDGTVFEANFADGAAIMTEGYAGWQIVNRPRDVGLTEWVGRNPLAIEIPFILDYWMASINTNPGIDCENQVSNLEHLCGVGGHSQPPICYVDGKGVIPHDNTIAPGFHQWVVETVTWDRDMEIRSQTTGRRLRCGGMIVVRKFVAAEEMLRTIKSTDRATGSGKKPKHYRVKKGDTLGKIAARKDIYGDASKWRIIADANNIRDRRHLKVNKRLIIPAI
jgi:LysM domain